MNIRVLLYCTSLWSHAKSNTPPAHSSTLDLEGSQSSQLESRFRFRMSLLFPGGRKRRKKK